MPRILLIEDNPADVYLIREALARTSGVQYEIDVAEDGDEALNKLVQAEANPPQLIILDLNLPKTDGANLVRRIRGNPTLAETVVVTWTSSAKASDSQQMLELGADRHIVKPLQWEEYEGLGRLLASLIQQGRNKG
jgi:CheY-like chemotaxis protein